MEFKILAHACMLVSEGDTRLIVDPWLIGSCYWRSWWHFPELPSLSEEIFRVDYIYLTHEHVDHCHYPSLRKFSRDVVVLVPKTPIARLAESVASLGFKNIVELPHGKKSCVGNLWVTSYQFGLNNDSALVVQDGPTTLLNLNDCKIRGASLRQLLRDHPAIDFVFKSHSSAAAYPFCYEAEDPNELRYRQREHYALEFVEAAHLIRPRYAIPFASNMCYLHKDTYRFNHVSVSPLEVQQVFEHHGPSDTACVVMLPGDSWSAAQGFTVSSTDCFERREEWIEAYRRKRQPVLDAYYRDEEPVTLQFEAFRHYFQALMDALPSWLRLVFAPTIIFDAYWAQPCYWSLDFKKRQVLQSASLPADFQTIVRVPPLVLQDGVDKHMFATFTASKRLSVYLRKGAIKDDFIFWQLLDLYETGYFPLRKTVTARCFTVWFQRRRELGVYMRILARSILKRFLPKRGKEDWLTSFLPTIGE